MPLPSIIWSWLIPQEECKSGNVKPESHGPARERYSHMLWVQGHPGLNRASAICVTPTLVGQTRGLSEDSTAE